MYFTMQSQVAKINSVYILILWGRLVKNSRQFYVEAKNITPFIFRSLLNFK